MIYKALYFTFENLEGSTESFTLVLAVCVL